MLGWLRKLRQILVRCRTELTMTTMVTAALYIEELRSRYAIGQRLEAAGYKVYSQNDEDGIIAEIFRRIGTDKRHFIEFGCGDGRENNTAFLLLQGWTGLWLDGSPSNRTTAQRLWASEIEAGRLTVREAFITADNIDELLLQNGFSGDIDLLVIDIDGNDYHVWEALRSVHPRVVCIEYNGKFPPPVEWVMPRNDPYVWDGSDWFGASLVSFDKLAGTKGYTLVGCNLTGVNAFFVRSDLVPGKFAEPASPEHLYQPPRYFLTPAFRAGHLPRK